MTVFIGTESYIPKISQWHLQDDEDIYDSINDWDMHDYLLIMKDGTELKASGYADEGFTISKNINFNGRVEDILFWLEIPHAPNKKDLEIYGYFELKHYIHSYRESFINDIKNGN